jgi:hypothetical protein
MTKYESALEAMNPRCKSLVLNFVRTMLEVPVSTRKLLSAEDIHGLDNMDVQTQVDVA